MIWFGTCLGRCAVVVVDVAGDVDVQLRWCHCLDILHKCKYGNVGCGRL